MISTSESKTELELTVHDPRVSHDGLHRNFNDEPINLRMGNCDKINTAHAKETGGNSPLRVKRNKTQALYLAGFLVHNVLPDDRIELAQLQPFFTVVPVFLGEIAVIAGFALEFND